MAKTVIVIGAGAAGLMAAVSAARHGASVILLEAQERPGRKLLVTGNGRCNLTNTDPKLSTRYHGTGSALAEKLLKEYKANDTICFFEKLGLLTRERDGYVYPYTAQASSVLDVLLAELRVLRVKLKFSQQITEITVPELKGNPADSVKYLIHTPSWTYQADSVILACGSNAAPSTGAATGGYLLAKKLGHTVIGPYPALVPFVCAPGFPEAKLTGVRCRAEVTLLQMQDQNKNSCDSCLENNLSAEAPKKDTDHLQWSSAKILARDTGELQWTSYGVSGIVIFQLSRYFPFSDRTSRNSDCALQIDFVPDYTETELQELLADRAERLNKEAVSILLRGIVNEKIIPFILKRAMRSAAGAACPWQALSTDRGGSRDGSEGALPNTCAECGRELLFEIVRVLKGYLLPVTGTRSFEQAQICMGGVDCREISDCLESHLHKGLYFAGEMLDVDGPCGGYNLQWAWTSGYLAGRNAAEQKMKGVLRNDQKGTN